MPKGEKDLLLPPIPYFTI